VYTLDATLGIPLVLLFLRAAHATAMRLNATLLIDSGYYGDPPQWQIWGAQATAYTLVLLLMKATNLGVLAALYTPLARVSSALFATFAQHRHLELLLVMIIVPGVFNTCQFWVRNVVCSFLCVSVSLYVHLTWTLLGCCCCGLRVLDLRFASEVRRRALEIPRAARHARREAPDPPPLPAAAQQRDRANRDDVERAQPRDSALRRNSQDAFNHAIGTLSVLTY
jgi:hypothetical protein